jgi:hypothetical protein
MFQNDIARECNYQMALPIHKLLCFKQTWGGAHLTDGTCNSQVCMFQPYMRCACSCMMSLLFHKVVWFRQTWDGAQLSDGTSTSQVCMFRTEVTRGCSRQMALLLHNRVCFKMTSRVSAAVRWPFLFTSQFVCFKQTWRGARLSTGTSNSQVCMFQTSMRCEYSCLMALICHTVVWFRQTWDGAQLSDDGTSTSQVCMFRTDIPHESSCQMALLLHTAVCFKQTLRVRAVVKWHFFFTSLYVSIRHHARMQLSDGTSTLQVCMLQSYTTRECSW